MLERGEGVSAGHHVCGGPEGTRTIKGCGENPALGRMIKGCGESPDFDVSYFRARICEYHSNAYEDWARVFYIDCRKICYVYLDVYTNKCSLKFLLFHIDCRVLSVVHMQEKQIDKLMYKMKISPAYNQKCNTRYVSLKK